MLFISYWLGIVLEIEKGSGEKEEELEFGKAARMSW
jgi:hypothetical protein